MQRLLFLLAALVAGPSAPQGQLFQFPTANRALLEPGEEERFFVGTVGRPWPSGTFGCVRTEGWQMHEGIDIRALERDRRGEPIDPVMASADGTVVYINDKPGLSNYGRYIILRHQMDGLEIFTKYAHLRQIGEIASGQKVRAGEVIGTLGRTANTRQGISKDRAHLHFEITLMKNDRFAAWFGERRKGSRNDHAAWNGQNFFGLDPAEILLSSHQPGDEFSILQHLREQTELCRVLVRSTYFPWLKRYTPLVRRNPVAEEEGVAGYEMALNYNGVPFQLIPRAPSEMTGAGRFHLLSVNEEEYERNPCRRLVVRKGSRWELGRNAETMLDLLTY
jgi:peptidoglycan LD-endopeptidase LytH